MHQKLLQAVLQDRDDAVCVLELYETASNLLLVVIYSVEVTSVLFYDSNGRETVLPQKLQRHQIYLRIFRFVY